MPQVYEWCGLEGTVNAMKSVGADPASGQLEPAIVSVPCWSPVECEPKSAT